MNEILLFSMPAGGEWFLLLTALFCLTLLPAIFFLLTLDKTLKAVAPQHRRMNPGEVWLLLIPVFSLFWRFFVVSRVADSLAAEYEARGVVLSSRPGAGIGLAYSICALLVWVPGPGLLATLATLVCWIVYWVKIDGHKNNLQALQIMGSRPDNTAIFY